MTAARSLCRAVAAPVAGAAAVLALLLTQGCAVASATAGAAVSVTGAVVSAGVGITGKAIGAGINALSSPSSQSDGSGIVVRERIRPADAPAAPRCAPAAGDGPTADVAGCR